MRIVLTIAHDDARHRRQRFRGVHAQLGGADLRRIDDIDRGGQVETGVFSAGATDDHHVHWIADVIGNGGEWPAGAKGGDRGTAQDRMLHYFPKVLRAECESWSYII